MVANVRGFTPNYKFKLINFDTPRWHTLEYDNLNMIDALLLQSAVPQIRGTWFNNILYVAGDRVLDGDTGALYRCVLEHTSAATGTFEEDRSNPAGAQGKWVYVQPGVPLYRDAWAAGNVYSPGDIVHIDEYAFYLCGKQHTSSTLNSPEVVPNEFWEPILDASQIVADATAAKNTAVGAANTATDQANIATGAASDAQNSADAAQVASEDAQLYQGAFKWIYSGITSSADPGASYIRFNSPTPGGVNYIYISALTADQPPPDVSEWIASWDDSTNSQSRGTVFMRKLGAPEQFILFNVTGNIADIGSWLQVPVAPISWSGSLTDGETLVVAFSRSGNQGPSGPGGGDLYSENNLLDVASVAEAATNLGVGATSVPTFSQVILSNPPTADDHVATKKYAEDTRLDRVAKAGDTMTGDLIIVKASPKIILDKTDGGAGRNHIFGRNNGADRWELVLGSASPETGASVGSDMALWCYDDANTRIQVLVGTRATGLLSVTNNPTSPLGIATKQYVDALSPLIDGRVKIDGTTPMTGALTVNVKGSMFGVAGGTVATGAVTPADANIKLYDFGSGNWAGIGTDTSGHMWFRTGVAGSLAPAMHIRSDNRVTNFAVSPEAPTPVAADNSNKLATTAFVVGAANTFGANKVSRSGDTMTGALAMNTPLNVGISFSGGGIGGAIAPSGWGGFAISSTTAHPLQFSYNNSGPNVSIGSGGLTVSCPSTFNDAVNFNTGSVTVNTNIPLTINQTYYIAYPGPSNFMVQSSSQPVLTFHAQGAFACNFGMDSGGAFHKGGWSFGQTNYRFWTAQETGWPASNLRLVYVGDYGHAYYNGMEEPHGSAVHTGASGGYTGQFRYRQVQLYTSSWWAVPYA